ncbi:MULTISPECIES: hypothetical protein [Actinomadura]|uniref:MerR family transcriptional regulator n=1 Tax=Actinomadura litoris TaxID=2678616 RepID=A0A7K1KY09_9ACTN|nr:MULTISPECIES: hypothetical protein [Actinomadura]MBT2209094.1 hypothetical protein [Actinomadura sp. NEAU-AAG7]MUN37090.1 hypothetical protein [Actinomadura litoris]
MIGQEAEEYPVKKYGLVAQASGIDADAWMTPRFAAMLVGVNPTRLNRWAAVGLLSYQQRRPGAHRRYLREELLVVSGLGVDGDPPTIYALRRHVRRSGRRGGGGEVGR